jgi:hypothetical protein
MIEMKETIRDKVRLVEEALLKVMKQDENHRNLIAFFSLANCFT